MSEEDGFLTREENAAIQSVVYCIARVDLWLFIVVDQALKSGDTRFFGDADRELIRGFLHIHDNCQSSGNSWIPSYNGHISQDDKIRRDIRSKWNGHDLIFAIITKHPIPYLERAIEQEIDTYQHARTRYLRVEERGAEGLFLPSEYSALHGADTTQYFTWCRSRYHDAHRALLQIHRISLELRSAIRDLIALDESMNYGGNRFKDLLKPRMSALNENFPNLCGELGKPVQKLIGEDPRWWIVEPQTNHQSKTGAAAASQSSNQSAVQMPSNTTATDLNGPQLNSSVFNAPVYFGDVRSEKPRPQASGAGPQNKPSGTEGDAPRDTKALQTGGVKVTTQDTGPALQPQAHSATQRAQPTKPANIPQWSRVSFSLRCSALHTNDSDPRGRQFQDIVVQFAPGPNPGLMYSLNLSHQPRSLTLLNIPFSYIREIRFTALNMDLIKKVVLNFGTYSPIAAASHGPHAAYPHRDGAAVQHELYVSALSDLKSFLQVLLASNIFPVVEDMKRVLGENFLHKLESKHGYVERFDDGLMVYHKR